MDVIEVGKINITQLALTTMAIIGIAGLVANALIKAVFKAWTDFKISQLESNNQILLRQKQLSDQLKLVQSTQNDIEYNRQNGTALPGSPEEKDNPDA